MFKLIAFFICILALAIAGDWLLQHDGQVILQLPHYQIATTLVAGLTFLILCVVGIIIISKLFFSILAIPNRIHAYRKRKRTEHGYQFLADAALALASGQADRASSLVAKAKNHQIEHPLITFISAETLRLTKHVSEATLAFEHLSKQKATATLGSKGLLLLAEQEGNLTQARQRAEEAIKQKKQLAWAGPLLLNVYIKLHAWKDALALHQRLVKKNILQGDTTKTQAGFLFALAVDAKAQQRSNDALRYSKQAAKLNPSDRRHVILQARCLEELGKVSKALKLLLQTFHSTPDLVYAKAYVTMVETLPANDQEKHIQRLVQLHPDHPASLYVEGSFALNRHQIITATKVIERLKLHAPIASTYQLAARLAVLQGAPEHQVSALLDQSSTAAPDPTLTCPTCERPLVDITTFCAHCSLAAPPYSTQDVAKS